MTHSLTILFGTHTGNSRALAVKAGEEARYRGYEVQIKDIYDLSAEELKNFKNIMIIVSTWYEGQPPDSVAHFHERLMQESPLGLEQLSYSVLGLGNCTRKDDRFCKCGRDIDQALERHGAKRIYSLVLCDMCEAGYNHCFEDWLEGSLKKFSTL